MIQTQTVLLGLVGLLGYVVYYCVAGLRANLVKARASGIPYIVVRK